MIGAHNGPFRKNRGIAQAGLDFDFRANLYQQIDTDGTDMARTSTLTDLVTVSRASKKTNAGGWDFTNGGTVGTLTEVNNNEPALDGTKGLLIEETSTNEVPNARMEGGATGSPGTLPTGWTGFLNGATQTINSFGVEDGWPYMEVRLSGTPSADISFIFQPTTSVIAANGETWTSSLGIKIVAGDASNITGIHTQVVERTAAGGFVAQSSGPNAITAGLDGTHRRFSNAYTLAGGGTVARVTNGLFIDHSGSGAIDITLRIYAPQLEEKEFPTSPILPPVSTPGASTRAVDTTQLSLGAWFDASAVSVCMNVIPAGDPIGIQAYFSNNTFNERIQLRRENTTRVRLGVWTGGVQGGDAQITSATPVVTGATYKYAFAVAANDMALSIGGETQATDSSVTMPTGMVDLQFGSDHSAALPWNGWIQDFRYFPERLTNAQLESMVGN